MCCHFTPAVYPNQPYQYPEYLLIHNIPNIIVDPLDGMMYIDIKYYGRYHRYYFSSNLKDLYVKCYHNEKENTIEEDIVELFYNGNRILVKRKYIKGNYLIDLLPTIGIYFNINAHKVKRAEAINMMVNMTINMNRTEIIKDESVWNMLKGNCIK